jgi:hypothetical protein
MRTTVKQRDKIIHKIQSKGYAMVYDVSKDFCAKSIISYEDTVRKSSAHNIDTGTNTYLHK